MVFDTKLAHLRNHFGITTPEDWRDVAPSWITSLHGFGDGVLNYLRLELATKNITLRDDRTAEFWREHLGETHITQTMGDPDSEENVERHRVCPFEILIDSAEQNPLGFQGMHEDASDGGRPLIVPTRWQCLGRHPDSYGDYTLAGYEQRVCVERKSLEDAQSTILGWDGRRERFESELANLSSVIEAGGAAVVVVEASFHQLLSTAPEYGKKTAAENRKALFRSVMSWQQRWKCQWAFCEGRRLAEIYTFDFLRMYWRKQREAEKAEKRVGKNEISRPALVVSE